MIKLLSRKQYRNFKRKIRFEGETYTAPKNWRFLKNGEKIKKGDVVMDSANINDLSGAYHPLVWGDKQNKYMIPSLRKIAP